VESEIIFSWISKRRESLSKNGNWCNARRAEKSLIGSEMINDLSVVKSTRFYCIRVNKWKKFT